jgi:subtilisin-like proprotein convertase family protein
MESKTVFRLALALSFLLAALSSKADSSFAGTGVGLIPDDSAVDFTYGTPLTVSFNVTNLQANVQSVSLSISMRHPWLGELDVQLKAPNGTNFIIFSRVGPNNNGYGSPATLGISGGTGYTNYTFADSATNTFRSFNTNGNPIPIPSGSYRTSSAGPNNDVATSFAANSGFIGLTPAQANGTWTLTFRDCVSSDQGAVQSATLTLGQQVVSLPPPRLTRIGVTNGFVTLNITGQISSGFTLYTTTNVAASQSWSTNAGFTFDPSGKATITTNTAGPMRFYRVSSP